MTTLDDIAARDAQYTPDVLRQWGQPARQAGEDRRYLLTLVREAREALHILGWNEQDGWCWCEQSPEDQNMVHEARCHDRIRPLYVRLTEGSDRT